MGIPVSVRSVSGKVAIVVGSAVVPPWSSPLAKRYFCLVDPLTGVSHLAAARFCIANGPTRRHELGHQAIMGFLVERRVALPPQAAPHYKVSLIRCCRVLRQTEFLFQLPATTAAGRRIDDV